MAIECNSILPEAQALQVKFQKCTTLSASDVRRILDLIISLKNCSASGSNGSNGTNGTNGLSAYQQALAGGFVGTESQWLISLIGATGQNGSIGPQGIQGIQGSAGNGIASIIKTNTAGLVDTYVITFTNGITTNFSVTNGQNGVNGYSAYELAVINGYAGSEASWVISLEGTPGTNGTNGTDSSNNLQRDESSSFSLSDTDNNFVIQLKNTANIIVTVPDTGLRAKFNCGFSRLGTGEVTFVGAGVVLLKSAFNGFRINRVGDPSYIERDDNSQSYNLYGNLKI